MHSPSQKLVRTVVVAAIVAAAGCAAQKPAPQAPVFFPPAPDLPRLQYLRSYTGNRDVEEQSSFNRFVIGENQKFVLDKPYGVAVSDGRIYVCDTNTTVTVLDLRAKTYTFLKGAEGAGQLRQPVNISIATDDKTRYVSDPVRGQVVAFDASDQFVRAFGKAGDWKPVDAVPWGDRLYVADIEKGRIVVFDRSSGNEVASFGDQGTGDTRLLRPSNLAFDRDGNLYVTDVGRFQVVKLDRSGGFLAVFGRLGDNLGHFARPKGVAVDRSGLVYVADAAFNNVQIFTPAGRLATFFGGPGQEPGNLMLPAKVTIDYDNVALFREYFAPNFEVEYLVFVTSQFGSRRLNVFGFGKEKGKQYPTEEELLKKIEERRSKAREGSAGR